MSFYCSIHGKRNYDPRRPEVSIDYCDECRRMEKEDMRLKQEQTNTLRSQQEEQRKQTDILRRQYEEQGTCYCCGTKFIEITRVNLQGKNKKWIGILNHYQGSGVCPTCYHKYATSCEVDLSEEELEEIKLQQRNEKERNEKEQEERDRNKEEYERNYERNEKERRRRYEGKVTSAVKLGSTIRLEWDERRTEGLPFDLNASLFMVNTSGKVPSNAYFIFYNQQKSPEGSVQHIDDRNGEYISVNFSIIPPEIQRLIIVVSVHEAEKRRHNFGQISNAFIRIVDPVTLNREIENLDLAEEFSCETAILFGEFYRRGTEWLFTLVGQGWSGGLNNRNYSGPSI